MKICISSPDGLGDFILRIPMIRAFEAAGHELLLLLREPAIGLATAIFPEIKRHEILEDPNHEATRRKKRPFAADHSRIGAFNPDLYVASLFSLSFLDEMWLEQNRGAVPTAGFTTGESYRHSATIKDPAEISDQFSIKGEAAASLPELEKNRLLASAILGEELPALTPSIHPSDESLGNARALLAHHGLEEGRYWVACVGSRSGLRMKDWGEGNWRQFFASTVGQADQPVIFLGNPKEYESLERIRSDSYRSVNLADSPPTLAESLAILSMSQGYLGRDSGVMHMAAATGVPVLAAYGGGHWGRFLPSSGPAIAVTQAMSCRMCDFYCLHQNPRCITEIRMETMIEAWRRLSSVKGVEILEQAPDPEIDTIPIQRIRLFCEDSERDRRRNWAKSRVEGKFRRLLGDALGIKNPSGSAV